MKILILASNPRKDLNLDDEIRLLRKTIELSRDRDRFEIVSEPGVRVGDLQGLLLRYKPQIVHFCGHGGGEAGLIFKMDGGGEQWVRADALAGMFKLNPICSNVKCVLLNACYSEEQANAIVSSIDYVVGMSHEIQDDAAIAFSKGFYLALGYGCSIDEAFEFGRNAIQLEISGSSKMRSAVSEGQRQLVVKNVVEKTEIPEHSKPILKKKATLIVEASPNTLSQETKVEIQLGIDKSLEEDSNVKQYREQVREYLSDRQLKDYEKDLLEVLRDELGLSREKANKIQGEELAPIRQARQAYETRLKALIKYYPFNEAIEKDLKRFQGQRNLTDAEVEEISRPILEQAEIADLEKRLPSFEFDVITVDRNGNEKTRARKSAKFLAEDLGKGILLEMVMIPRGTYLMGSPLGEGRDSEKPQHQVSIPPFFMGKYPITQAQWRAVASLPQVERELDPDPSYFKGENRPVEQVSWYGAVEFCARLSKLTGRSYRLPSEAEWEYACRAGTSSPFYFWETITTDLANYRGTDREYRDKVYPGNYESGPKGEYRQKPTPVGQFPPNAFGVYDLHGNIWEWCADRWHDSYVGAPTDGSAWTVGGNDNRSPLRGGSWDDGPDGSRSAARNLNERDVINDGIGFRACCACGSTLHRRC